VPIAQGGECPGYGASIVALVSQYGTVPSVWAAQSAVMVGTTALDSGGPLPVETGDLSAMWSFLQAQLGKPYQWGGAGPASWDCSGLVMVAYAQVGVPLEHNAAAQYAETEKAALPLDGTANLEPGDLLFWAYDTSDPRPSTTWPFMSVTVKWSTLPIPAPSYRCSLGGQMAFLVPRGPWRSTSYQHRRYFAMSSAKQYPRPFVGSRAIWRAWRTKRPSGWGAPHTGGRRRRGGADPAGGRVGLVGTGRTARLGSPPRVGPGAN